MFVCDADEMRPVLAESRLTDIWHHARDVAWRCGVSNIYHPHFPCCEGKFSHMQFSSYQKNVMLFVVRQCNFSRPPSSLFSDTSISSFLFAIASISFYCLLHSFVQASTDPLDYRLFLYPAWPIDFTDCGPCNRFLKILRLFFVLTMCRIDYAVHFISGDDCESTYISADIMNYVLLQR